MLDILIRKKTIQEKFKKMTSLASNLNYDGIVFPVKEKILRRSKYISVNVFGYEDKLVFPIYISNKNFDDSIDLLLLLEDNKSHYVYIKDISQNKK